MKSRLTGSVVSGVPIPLILIGQDERIIVANSAATKLFGDGVEGRHYILAMRQPALLDVIDATLRARVAGQARLVLTGPTQEVAYRVSTTPITDDQQNGALVAFEDVTELEQAGQIRRDFVANVSHELRTPLTALLGFIETLKGAAREDPAARERFLGIMEREAGRMNRLVSDLLSLSRVEAEERVRPTEEVDVAAHLAQAVAAMRQLSDAARVKIEVAGAAGPMNVPADADQLTQVFQNLIENAVKYGGPDRTVTVRISREGRDPSLRVPVVRIEVIDEGEGIDPIHLPRLTERFYRVDNHRSREGGGTGLGLAIVKHIVNRHRGRFEIESELGTGSTFAVILPAA